MGNTGIVEPNREFDAFVATAEVSDLVLGVVLVDSRAGDEKYVDARSDFDVRVVLRDEDASREFAARFPHVRGGRIEVVSCTPRAFKEHGEIGSPTEWARPQYLDARVLVDHTGGELSAVVAEKATIPLDVRDAFVAEALDGYINAYYRSARNQQVDSHLGARLDAAESIPSLLQFIFGVEGRVRPYNKYLALEIEHRPLADGAWASAALIPRLERVLRADLSEQQALFRDVERVARASGFGAVIDDWEPDLDWLRGGAKAPADVDQSC